MSKIGLSEIWIRNTPDDPYGPMRSRLQRYKSVAGGYEKRPGSRHCHSLAAILQTRR